VPLRSQETEIYFPDNKIRCAIAHEHGLLRHGLRRILEDEPDMEVVSEARNAAECLRKVHDLRPDVVVADAATIGLDPAEAQRLVMLESSLTKMVFFSSRKQASAEELLEMIRQAYSSSRPNYPDGVLARASSAPTPFRKERTLTSREREVLKLLAEGKTVRAAAMTLGLSVKTVDAHKFNLMRKLGLHNKAELVMWAIQKNIVQVPVNF